MRFSVDQDDTSQIHVRVEASSYEGLTSATVEATGEKTAELNLVYKTSEQLDPGVYEDSVVVYFCADASCDEPIEGSPYTVASNLTVNLVSSTGEEPLLLKEEDRKVISTDLFAATYVQSAGVFVAAVNSNGDELDNPPMTVISIDPVTGSSGLVGYLSEPAISISSDKTGATPRVVVGHANGYVTVFDYNATMPAASISYLLNTGESLGEVAVNGTDVFAIPATGISDLCGGIWSSANGDRLVSGCGDVFSTDANPAHDLQRLGSFEQPAANPLKDDQRIIWYADSAANADEVMTLSVKAGVCGPLEACPRTLSIFSRNSFAHRLSRTFGSFLAANDEPVRLELPVAAAYSADGRKLYVLTRLDENLPRDSSGELQYEVENAYVHVINR